MIAATSRHLPEHLPTRRHGRSLPAIFSLALVAACWGFHPSRAAAQDVDPPTAVEVDGEDVEVEGELDVIYEDDDRGSSCIIF